MDIKFQNQTPLLTTAKKNWWYGFNGLGTNTISSMKKKKGIKLYQKITESFIGIAICNKFIIWKTFNLNDPKDNFI